MRRRIVNKKIDYLYDIKYKIEAGMVLKGDEVKSIRRSSPSISETFCFFKNKEVFIRNFVLAHAYEVDRSKKLLLHHSQINRLIGLYKQKGFILMPLELFENEKGWFKIVIGIGTKLKKFDKRERLKQKDLKRESS